MPKISLFTFILLSSLLIGGCTNQKQEKSTNINLESNSKQTTMTSTNNPTISTDNNLDLSSVTLNTKYGPIVIKLYSDAAPKSVANFVKKSSEGFYNNLTFHRVEPGFVVQGGDPLGNGTGGGDIASEINNVPFKLGSVGLARGGNKAISNDSQFYICLATETCKHLTGEYVNFGEVVSGMEYVNKIIPGDNILSIDTKK